ncbi:helix-turn-helix domain-containing protein [Brevundimonas sp. SL130]|uniref:helix-turn-helix domain-containing protein n=1 Tax=Brevundimonas sp. SL130 TaxID=2995143 RepID=UPI003B6363CF
MEVPPRQSDIADLLAVRRAGVSTACGELQTAGAIRVRRGVTLLSDTAALRKASDFTRPQSSSPHNPDAFESLT